MHTQPRATPDEIEKARRLYAAHTDDIAIDDDAGASRTESGVWVQAWVWVPAADRTDDDDDT